MNKDDHLVQGPITYIDPANCTHFIMVGEHYRDNGDCLCSNAEHRIKMIAEWEYTPDDFLDVPLID